MRLIESADARELQKLLSGGVCGDRAGREENRTGVAGAGSDGADVGLFDDHGKEGVGGEHTGTVGTGGGVVWVESPGKYIATLGRRRTTSEN